MTTSESLFEQFCRENSIRYARIATRDDTKTPDYDVFPQETRVVVEVKELCPNNDEKGLWDTVRAGGTVAAFCNTSQRLRDRLRDAYKQLKARSKGQHPAILVLFDNGTVGGIDATDIKNAMYGDEEAEVTFAPDGDVTVRARLGQGRRCRPDANRLLSAVALLWTRGAAAQLSIFHNTYTTCRLPPELFAVGGCRQFGLVHDGAFGFPDWCPIVSSPGGPE